MVTSKGGEVLSRSACAVCVSIKPCQSLAEDRHEPEGGGRRGLGGKGKRVPHTPRGGPKEVSCKYPSTAGGLLVVQRVAARSVLKVPGTLGRLVKIGVRASHG